MVPTSHEKFIARAVSRLEVDARMIGLAAGGSYTTGELDSYSDLDLVVVVDPGSYVSVLQEMESLAHTMGPCLAGFTGEHAGSSALFICLYEDPLLHVDLQFVALDDFARRPENPKVLWERDGALTRVIEEGKPTHEGLRLQWMEDRFWSWIHYGAQKLGRGELFEVLDTLAFLRAQVLGPLVSARAGRPLRGVRRLEQFGEEEDLAALRATVGSYDPRACELALKEAAKAYVGLRETLAHLDLRRNRRAEMAALRYLHEVGEKFA